MSDKTTLQIVEDAADARDLLNSPIMHEALEKIKQNAILQIIEMTRRGLTAAAPCAILVAVEDLKQELRLAETEEVLLRRGRQKRV